MKALVYQGSEKKDWEFKEDPGLERPKNAPLKIDKTTICGTDLQILKGNVPEVSDGRLRGGRRFRRGWLGRRRSSVKLTGLGEILGAYVTFADAARIDALKVVIMAQQ